MKDVVLYTTNFCPYCVKAKRLLEKKGAEYEELRIDINSELREKMLAKSNGRKTVPQIFIDDFHVGGCDELYDLERDEKLDSLLMDES